MQFLLSLFVSKQRERVRARRIAPRSTPTLGTLLLLLALLITSCTGFGGSNNQSNSNTNRATRNPTIQNQATRVSGSSSSIDPVAAAVLQNMHLHSWNANAMTRGVVTGGLYINWKMDNPSVTNAVRPGKDGNPQHNHDIQVDLLYLNALAEYHQIHPQDHTFDSDLSRITPLVLADFSKYSLPKGWIYFYLLRDGLILHNTDLVNEAYGVASNLYTRWYDPSLGLVYDRAHTPGDYSTNDTLGSGAALIDAGLRWNKPTWVPAGESTMNHAIAVSLDPHYHLFYNNMIVSSDGHDKVKNYQAKPSTQGEAVDALVTAYQLTNQQQYLNVAEQVLQSTLSSSGLWDSSSGGFYFAIDMSVSSGPSTSAKTKSHRAVLSDYKETRSQSLLLVGLDHFNRVKAEFTQQEQQLVSVLTDHFYQGTYHGYFYRVTPDFRIYVSKAGAGIGVENYFTTEAMGSVLDGLQQTEL